MMKKVAMANPSVPPFSNPRFQPKYMPEITYPTPNPQSMRGERTLFNSGFGGFDKGESL
jgi:hypothetical protein